MIYLFAQSAVPGNALSRSDLSSSMEEEFQWFSQLPWLLLLLVSLPLIVAAYQTRTFPTRLWIGMLGVSILGSILFVFSPNWIIVVAVVDALIFLVTAIDFSLLWIGSGGRVGRGIEVTREIARTGSLRVPIETALTVRNRTHMRLIGEFCDDLPDHFVAVPAMHDLDLTPGMETTARSELTAHRRGAFELMRCYLSTHSPLR